MQLRRQSIFALIFFLALPVGLYGQNSTDLEQLRYQRALQEIEGVLVDAGKLDDPLMVVTVKSRAAALIWRYDRKRSQALFLDLWKYIDQQQSDAFNPDEARTVLLKYLYPNNPGLATRLLKEVSQRQSEESSLRSQVTGADPNVRRLANVSAGVLDQDPTIAARLLEQSLSISVTPTAISVLKRMRERNPILANYVISQTLDRIKSRPSIIALTGLHLLIGYLFPSEPYMAVPQDVATTDDVLRLQYFSTAYDVLKRSLEESDSLLKKEQRYTQNDLRYRAVYQGQIALALAALAPRFGPHLLEELNILARRLSGGAPANVANLSRFVVAQLGGDQANADNPEIAIPAAIARGDFDEAWRLVDQIEDETRRKSISQTLARAEFKARLSEADLTGALNVARKIENVNLRVLLLLQLARAAYRKDDNSQSRMILNEARSTLANAEKNGLLARVLLSFASEVSTISESDAMELLHNAVTLINSLSKPASDAESSDQPQTDSLMQEINDPRSLVESTDLQKAFSSVSRVDFAGTILAAGRLNPLPVQLVARLSASEVAFTKRVQKPNKVPAKKPPSAGNAKREP